MNRIQKNYLRAKSDYDATNTLVVALIPEIADDASDDEVNVWAEGVEVIAEGFALPAKRKTLENAEKQLLAAFRFNLVKHGIYTFEIKNLFDSRLISVHNKVIELALKDFCNAQAIETN